MWNVKTLGNRIKTAGKRDALVVASTAAGVMVFDAITKMLAERHLTSGVDLVAGGQLRLSHNSGVAFGMLNGAPQLVVVAIAGLVTTALALALCTEMLAPVRVAAGVVLGGALANLIDRVEGGGVTDFIDLGAWPSFNVADAALMCGLVVVAWRFAREPAARTESAQRPS